MCGKWAPTLAFYLCYHVAVEKRRHTLLLFVQAIKKLPGNRDNTYAPLHISLPLTLTPSLPLSFSCNFFQFCIELDSRIWVSQSSMSVLME